MAKIQSPFPLFVDVDGDPLESGYIYVGQDGLNPEVSPITVYSDKELTIPVAQPIRTIGGLPALNGAPIQLFASEVNYSLLVRNKNRTLVRSSLSTSDSLTVSNTLQFQTVADLEGNLPNNASPLTASQWDALATQNARVEVVWEDAAGKDYIDSFVIWHLAGYRSAIGEPSWVPDGRKFSFYVGGGVLYVAVLQGDSSNALYATNEQETWYTMSPNRHVFGEEYLWGFHKQVFDSSNENENKFVWSGDSTTAGDNAGGYTPSFIGSVLSEEFGLARHQHINSGHSGKAATDWDSLYVGQDIVNHPDMNVYVARWGINDGFWHNNVATYIAAMDSGLGKLRAHKDVDELAIVVVSPNATYDDPNNRGTEWYENIVPELRKICRKHRAVFIDIYSIWQDAKQGAVNTGSTSTGKRWLDNPYGDGRGIHPDASFACQIGLRITEMIIKPALVKAVSRYNLVSNTHPDQFNPSAATQPFAYPRFLGCYHVVPADGWPFEGKLRTTRNGSKVVQELFLTEPEDSTEVGSGIYKRRIVRFGDTVAGLWSKWYNRAVAPGLLNGWGTHNSQTQKYVHREDGSCSIEGAITGGTDGTIAFALPAEMHPANDKTFITRGSAGFFSLVDVLANGNVVVSKNGGTFCGLDGVVWTAGD